jgi:serine/threonine protein phosphatase PrpC
MYRLDIRTLYKQGGRSYQEDSYGVAEQDHIACLVLADGAGGHGGGHIASQLAVRSVLEVHQREPLFSADALLGLMLHAHQVVKAGQQKFTQYPDMRSTLVVALVELNGGRVLLGNVGDSRAYLFAGSRLVCQTRDHSMVQQLVEAGYVQPAEVRRQPQRSVLLASLGMQEELQPHVIEAPAACGAGDTLLLCTDGFWEYVPEDFVQHALAQGWSLQEALDHFDAQVLLAAKPGHDNYTAMLAQLKLDIGGDQADAEDTVRTADFDETVIAPDALGPAP